MSREDDDDDDLDDEDILIRFVHLLSFCDNEPELSFRTGMRGDEFFLSLEAYLPLSLASKLRFWYILFVPSINISIGMLQEKK